MVIVDDLYALVGGVQLHFKVNCGIGRRLVFVKPIEHQQASLEYFVLRSGLDFLGN